MFVAHINAWQIFLLPRCHVTAVARQIRSRSAIKTMLAAGANGKPHKDATKWLFGLVAELRSPLFPLRRGHASVFSFKPGRTSSLGI